MKILNTCKKTRASIKRKENRFKEDIIKRQKPRCKKRRANPVNITAYVRPESGYLAITIGQVSSYVNGANDIEISYDELVTVAFDIRTLGQWECIEYQTILRNAQKIIKKENTDW
jgi:hypothetical protein